MHVYKRTVLVVALYMWREKGERGLGNGLWRARLGARLFVALAGLRTVLTFVAWATSLVGWLPG